MLDEVSISLIVDAQYTSIISTIYNALIFQITKLSSREGIRLPRDHIAS